MMFKYFLEIKKNTKNIFVLFYKRYVILGNDISMGPHKVVTILHWKIPKTIRDIQCFIGFSNFYQLFIKRILSITASLTQLILFFKLQ
jgi:hypothetical protein